MSIPWAVHVISDTRLPPAFRAFISGGRREPGDEVIPFSLLRYGPEKSEKGAKVTCICMYYIVMTSRAHDRMARPEVKIISSGTRTNMAAAMLGFRFWPESALVL